MDPYAVANVDRRLKLMAERLERLETLVAALTDALAEPDEAAVEGMEADPAKPWTSLGISKATYYRRLKDRPAAIDEQIGGA
jgi:hypothetical protein